LLAFGTVTYAQEDKKSKKAREHLESAEKEVHEAHADSAADYNNFKEKADLMSKENDKKIAALKEKNKMASKDVKEAYEKKIREIEVRNEKLRRQLSEASTTKTSKWSQFKREFYHDVDEMNKSIDDLTKDNVK
jgi:Mg-chelatase subunit ChlI